MAQRHGVSLPTARTPLTTLEDAGVLRAVSAARSHRVWEAHEVFAVLDDIERRVVA